MISREFSRGKPENIGFLRIFPGKWGKSKWKLDQLLINEHTCNCNHDSLNSEQHYEFNNLRFIRYIILFITFFGHNQRAILFLYRGPGRFLILMINLTI